MDVLVNVLIIIASILIILVVLVQNSKGGGLSSTFASSNQIMGVRKTTDFLEKATWGLAISLVVLCLLSTLVATRPSAAQAESALKEELAKQPKMPMAPAGTQNPSAPAAPQQ